MKKYLLSTGNSTVKIEQYILDLFKLYLNIYPKDIPGASYIGFDFILKDTKKDELIKEINNRIKKLILTIKERIPVNDIEIKLDSTEIIDESRIKITITVNNYTEEIEKNIIEEN